MSNTNTNHLFDLIAAMADERRSYAADNGFTASNDEIADSIKASLIRMMSEAN